MEHLEARGPAGPNADIGFTQTERLGQKSDQCLVGGSFNRWCGQTDLQCWAAVGIWDHTAHCVFVGPRRDPYG
jgi:hypothetical protein